MDKKAQGMSMNVIIVAVLALVILVVLVLIFTGKIKLFSSSSSETAAKYTGKTCAVPGTNNECGLSEDSCRKKGGSYDSTTAYDDCTGCCSI